MKYSDRLHRPRRPGQRLGQQYLFEDLTVMHRRVRDHIAPNKFLLPGHSHMILVAVVTDAMLARPAGLGIFLTPFSRLRLPLRETVAGLDRGVFLPDVALGWPGDQRGINYLPPGLYSVLREIAIKLLKEPFAHPGLRYGLPKQPDSLGVGNPLLDIEPRLRKVKGYRHLPRLREALKRELKLERTATQQVA